MPCAAELGPVERLGQRFGTYQVVVGFAWVVSPGKGSKMCFSWHFYRSLTSLPIQGALIPYDDGGYTYLILFSGICVLCGTIFICIARMLRVGWNWKAWTRRGRPTVSVIRQSLESWIWNSLALGKFGLIVRTESLSDWIGKKDLC